MAAVASGDLRHRVQLQSLTTAQNPVTGEIEQSWSTIAEPWAQVVPMSAREFVAAAAEQSEVRGRMVMRYRGEVDATMRIVFRGKWYAIFGVLPDAESGKEHLTLLTGEGVRLDQ
jgi:SPP1 family predicted phage head-tail adaptor